MHPFTTSYLAQFIHNSIRFQVYFLESHKNILHFTQSVLFTKFAWLIADVFSLFSGIDRPKKVALTHHIYRQLGFCFYFLLVLGDGHCKNNPLV